MDLRITNKITISIYDVTECGLSYEVVKMYFLSFCLNRFWTCTMPYLNNIANGQGKTLVL